MRRSATGGRPNPSGDAARADRAGNGRRRRRPSALVRLRSRGVEADLSALESAVADADASLVVTPAITIRCSPRCSTASRYPNIGWPTARPSSVTATSHRDRRRSVRRRTRPSGNFSRAQTPCFYGPAVYEGSDVLVLPAFTRAAAGAAVNRMRSGLPVAARHRRRRLLSGRLGRREARTAVVSAAR